jgi:molybdenum cofactor biosynthesis protein MoaC
MLSAVSVDLVVGNGRVDITAVVETTGPTGVEMEALTACSVAALTLYDMCKSADKNMSITHLALHEKSGGRSGDYQRPAE